MAVPLMFQPLVKYVQFEGRSRRSEFWLWVLFRFILSQVLGAIALAFIGPLFAQLASHPETINAHPDVFFQNYIQTWLRVAPLFSLVSLGLLLPSLAVGVRRLHDINRTGWWLIMPYVVMIVGVTVFFIVCGAEIFAAAGHGGAPSSADGTKAALTIVGSVFLCIFAPFLIAGIVMLIFFVTEGTKGANRFGPDPKAPGAEIP